MPNDSPPRFGAQKTSVDRYSRGIVSSSTAPIHSKSIWSLLASARAFFSAWPPSHHEQSRREVSQRGHRLDQDLEPLALLDAAEEQDLRTLTQIQRPGGREAIDVDPVRNDAVIAGKISLRQSVGGLGHRGPSRHLLYLSSQPRLCGRISNARIRRRVEGPDDRGHLRANGKKRNARDQRFVDVHDVRRQSVQFGFHPRRHPGAERDGSDRSVCRYRHRPADRADVVGQVPQVGVDFPSGERSNHADLVSRPHRARRQAI